MKKITKLLALALAVSMSIGLTACKDGTGVDKDGVKVGAAIYKYDDTFMTGVRNAMESRSEALKADLRMVNSNNDQSTQNNQVQQFITQELNALAINPVDRTAAGPLINQAKDAGIPIVFLNREPEKNHMDSYDKVWYVGAKAEESGTMSGQIMADYWNANKDKVDRNGDGKLQYIMLTGEPGHQDAILRTEYSMKAITEAGIEVEELANDTAMWDKVKATDKMTAWITSHGVEKIEGVFCNNDDMALGAIEALKAAGYNTGDAAKFTPVVGVDATAPALAAMEDGSLLGTVLNDAENQGKATINVAVAAAKGLEINKANTEYDVTDGKYIWIPYVKVTKDNYKDFK